MAASTSTIAYTTNTVGGKVEDDDFEEIDMLDDEENYDEGEEVELMSEDEYYGYEYE